MKKCRWRVDLGPASSYCTSPKLLGPGKSRPFDPKGVCSGCSLIDHEPEADGPAPRPRKPKMSISQLAEGRL